MIEAIPLKVHPRTVYESQEVKVKQSLQAWTGPEGSRSLKLPDFKTIST
jgi:hypothetical protein